jgi:hypothetical protein
MKAVIAVILIGVAALISWFFYDQWNEVKNESDAKPAPVQVVGNQLPGMNPSLEPQLDKAMARGADGLHDFLRSYGPKIQDPRRASIELDYVVLVAKKNPAEARAVFARVKERTDSSSPVYPRVKQLEKTFE